jgi:hypothetical protein
MATRLCIRWLQTAHDVEMNIRRRVTAVSAVASGEATPYERDAEPALIYNEQVRKD